MSAAVRVPVIREWDGEAAIPLAEWGRDHWSTLAFIECKCVDGIGGVAVLKGGVLDHMRCNPRRHRGLLGTRALAFGPAWADEYSTRLADDSIAEKHDDWDCVNDLVDAGLLIVRGESFKRGKLFGGGTIKLQLTDLGIAVANELRAHKARGGTWGTFGPATASAERRSRTPSKKPASRNPSSRSLKKKEVGNG